eukprot:3086641-Lingulodinium_polyedra.AAC.1
MHGLTRTVASLAVLGAAGVGGPALLIQLSRPCPTIPCALPVQACSLPPTTNEACPAPLRSIR